VISRLGELTQLATDVTKSTSDLQLYQTEVDSLKKQMNSLLQETFNGVSLFSTNGATSASVSTSVTGAFNIIASQDGSQTIGISKADFGALFGMICGTASGSGVSGSAAFGSSYSGSSTVGLNIATTTSQAGFQTVASLGTSSIAIINSAIQAIATLRANNGAEQSRLGFAADVLSINKSNLEAANSRILDVDIAEESAKLARFNILQQAGTAMLAQANQSTQSILRLLM
jgi:flagellin